MGEPLLVIDEKEITLPIFVEMLKESFQLGVTNGVEFTLLAEGRACTDEYTLRRVNAILKKTWGNDAWLKRYFGSLLARAKASLEEEQR